MSAERVFELAPHLTERDREIALALYDHQLLTTDQLQLLFFSSTRRAQDRLLFLYRQRVVDRFYPPSPFGAGKPQAHWLLDEAGAILVCAMLGVERKELGWRRRDDWGSHPQLVHRLEANRFVTDLIAATLSDPTIGVGVWYSSRRAAERLHASHELVRPDAGFILDTPAGAIECYLEWDRGTETQARLIEKLCGYRRAEGKLRGSEPRNVVFVGPGGGRVQTLRRAYADFEPKREHHRRVEGLAKLDGRWPLLAASVCDLRREGMLARVWHRIDAESERRLALTELPVRGDLTPADLELALGRRWRKEHPQFWQQLSPLHRRRIEEHGIAEAPAPESVAADSPVPADDPEGELVLERVRQLRAAPQEELRRDLEAARSGGSWRAGAADLRPSGADGLMLDPDAELEEEQWR